MPATVLEPIDLLHRGIRRSVGCYLLETREGPALLDCGPTSCLPELKRGLAARGLALSDLRHILLTHIHLDHAGAAGAIVREQPSLVVHVSAVGAPHLVDPSRLERSARRLYGDDFDPLWGELAPVPEANVRLAGDDVLGLACFPAPGHATHHVAYLDAAGTLYAGDSCGVSLQPAAAVIPATPPPDIDLEGWAVTLAEIERRQPERIALIHFGVTDRPREHVATMRRELARWAGLVESGLGRDEFVETCRRELVAAGVDDLELWESAASIAQCYAGLERYWEKRRQAEH